MNREFIYSMKKDIKSHNYVHQYQGKKSKCWYKTHIKFLRYCWKNDYTQMDREIYENSFNIMCKTNFRILEQIT